MATSTGKDRCITCCKEKRAVRCEGCLQLFCFDHLSDHRQELSHQLDDIEMNRDIFRQTLTEQAIDSEKHPLIKNINQWEDDSIKKIQQIAQECRQQILEYTSEHIHQIEVNLAKLTDQLRRTRQENDFNEIDICEFKQKITQLAEEFDKPLNISIQQNSTSLVNQISVVVSTQELASSTSINIKTKWKQNGITVAGGNGRGEQLGQLFRPHGIYVDDDDECIYIADWGNHRIVEWKYDAENGEIIAGANGKGDQINQLNLPVDVILDRNNDSLIICDYGNRRVVRWSRRNRRNGQVIISDIDCSSLAMDSNGNLYVSDCEKDEVRRWKIGEKNGTIVAGGNGQGNQLNQLNDPTYIFVDKDQSIYISDSQNHRVMKWMRNAKEGIVVAGGQGKGNSLGQLNYPNGVSVDRFDNIYVADSWNNRIMCWPKGSKEGSIVVGGNREGQQSNQFNYLRGLSFDRQGNLYAVDKDNNRVQRFDIDLD